MDKFFIKRNAHVLELTKHLNFTPKLFISDSYGPYDFSIEEYIDGSSVKILPIEERLDWILGLYDRLHQVPLEKADRTLLHAYGPDFLDWLYDSYDRNALGADALKILSEELPPPSEEKLLLMTAINSASLILEGKPYLVDFEKCFIGPPSFDYGSYLFYHNIPEVKVRMQKRADYKEIMYFALALGGRKLLGKRRSGSSKAIAFEKKFKSILLDYKNGH